MRRIPRRPSARFVVFALALAAAGCNAAPRPGAAPRTAAVQGPSDTLNATVWVQTAAEYTGATLQAYRQAEAMLEAALADSSWSASLEQLRAGGYADLPPAVILDVDETVLDNSPHQVRLIDDGEEFNTANWHAWVREEKATPIPGALEFTRAAAARGVAVFYVTNRRHEVEEATRGNLVSQGFPFAEQEDRLLTRDERPEWTSDKGTRREEVGARYRILLLIGDNFGDFASEIDVDVAQRARMALEWAEFWGRRWIVLPNPVYGSWEGALFDFDYGAPLEERRRRKRAALRDER